MDANDLLRRAAKAAPADLRQKFEAWDKGAVRARNTAGDYSNPYVQSSWDGYQAGYAQAIADLSAAAALGGEPGQPEGTPPATSGSSCLVHRGSVAAGGPEVPGGNP
ncbi:hypothetical protein CAL26_09100 [Bordetella genomosp. 9]|uniref:Uncharacterized protein n=1 Tax=Bordetella genomosp. 9 TaxID=1416803 RepID=A0A261RFN4_9BORD|nr:hypothetical protein [Bordetella genomosp. 9]OZI23587.1 hypothetical protein CAL26_09100 [Bordetella genomosp. 9]